MTEQSEVVPANRKPFAVRHFFIWLLLYFAGSVAFGFHGSSIDMYAVFQSGHKLAPLLGTPKPIRSDEWAVHTPDILNQVLRADPFARTDSAVGPKGAALLGNIPVKSTIMLVRPQFWAFFFLPLESAYSVYWQLKAVILLGGIFLLLFLVTENAAVSATLAIFFYFSAFIQWAYSWPTQLPEMIGSACLAVSLSALSLLETQRMKIMALAIGAGVAASSFALCIYPPHQIPVAWAAVTILAWWMVENRCRLWEPALGMWRIGGLFVSATIIIATLLVFYFQAHDAITAATQTVYPGQRRIQGGGASAIAYLSSFLDFWKSADNTTKGMGNICEATGFLWFGPLSLIFCFCLRGSRAKLYFLLLVLFCAYCAWMFFPIPAEFGHPFGFDLVVVNRLQPGLGIINVVMMAAFCKSFQPPNISTGFLIVAAIPLALLFYVSLYNVGQSFQLDLSQAKVVCSVLLIAVVMIGFVLNQRILVALTLTLPLIFSFALVNPVDRGFNIVTNSALQTFISTHPGLKLKRWIVFSPHVIAADYFVAHGLDVFNAFRIVPDLEAFSRLDRGALHSSIYNNSGFLLANESSQPDVSFRMISTGVASMEMKPTASILKSIGVSVVAFYRQPAPDIVSDLRLISEDSIDSFWIYETK